MLWESVLLVVTLCYMVNLYLSWNKNYWLRKGFPFVEPRVFFGNIRDVVLMRKTIGQAYQEIYVKLGNKPLGGFFKVRQPILMVKHPDLVREVLVDKFDCFQSNDIHVRRDANPLLKMNPILVSGATWRSMKSVWSPLLSDKTLTNYTAMLQTVSQKMVTFLASTSGQFVEGKELSRKFVSDVVANWAIGIELDSFQDVNVRFRMMSDRILKRNFKSNVALLFAMYAPSLSNFFHFRIVSRRATKYFLGLISGECQKRVQEQEPKRDFLQYLIDINKESEKIGEGTVFNYDKIMGHSVNLFFNGLIMMSDPFCWCLYEIGKHPDVQSRLREEIISSGVNNIEQFTLEKLQDLQYLESVLMECCRLHPPIQSITRICNKETVLEHDGHKYVIEVGTPVNVPIYALHMDPNHFPEPERFNPERFNSKSPNTFTPIPFSAGPRGCPGEQFAKMILKLGMAALVLNYRIQPHEDLKFLDQDPMSSLVNRARGDVPLRFTPISAHS